MANTNNSPTLEATSAVRRSGMSITLPRNFAPMSLDSNTDEPRTPDQTFADLHLPPPPPHSTYRVRRHRLLMNNIQARNNALPNALFASEIPPSSSPLRPRSSMSFGLPSLGSDDLVPSIEISNATERPHLLRGSSEPLGLNTLCTPIATEPMPQTPVAQTNTVMTEAKRGSWDMQRSASVCSIRSDSSTSSDDTYATRPTSFDGSTTSPDCDNQDPFSPQMVNIIPDTPTRQRKKIRINTSFPKDNVHWSIEMDNHLFNVYQMYLADPTVTPFKTVPGSIPPTGVCHRVARRARETWPKASRISVPIIKRYRVRNILDIKRSAREKTPEPEDFLRTDDAAGLNDAKNSWPSESSTRRRLKQLCREKFTITAHYQRLRESRSPSPFSEQFTKRPFSRPSHSMPPQNDDQNQAVSYTTRELGISLVASDATAPLAQLMSEDSQTTPSVSPHDWFNTPVHSTQAEPSTTSSITSSVHLNRLAPSAAKIPRLASPFNYSTWNCPSNRNPHRRHISHGQYDTIHATGTRLLSPFQHDAKIAVNANKRRAQHNLEEELSPNGSNIADDSNAMSLDGAMDFVGFRNRVENNPELIFTGHGDINQRRIRLRNRGATLGSALNLSGKERMERLFHQPQIPQADIPVMPEIPAFVGLAAAGPARADSPGGLTLPEVDPIQRRLGSPFELDPNKRSQRSKAPRHVPSLSDPFISTDHFGLNNTAGSDNPTFLPSNMGNIGERLALFGNLHQSSNTPGN